MTSTDEIKIVAAPDAESESETGEVEIVDGEAVAAVDKKPTKVSARSRKYYSVRSKVDKTKHYEPAVAIELIKKLSYTSFTGSLELHAVIREEGANITLSLPHSTGRTLKVAIVSDELLTSIGAGTIDFDVLVCAPQFMPKLAKFARVLGPKGLMPNPKNGTLTDNPELKKKELEGGKVTIRGEKKAPLLHMVVGKLDMDSKQLVENLEAALKALRGKAIKVSIAASMSPGVKIALVA